MNANFHIDTDAASDLLKVTLSGFMSVDEMGLLRWSILAGMDTLHCRRGQHLAMYDVRTCKIQPQNVVAMLRSMSDAKGVAARKIAVVVGDSLMRMQLPRILVGRDARMFDEVPPAIVWLKRGAAATGSSLCLPEPRPQRPHSVTI